ncbi:putative Ig domain-containing protein, partial [Desulfobulbus propionicus]
MYISGCYKYSWFADLAYVQWDDNNLIGNDAIGAAVDAERVPQKLAEKIFLTENENYSVLNYHSNDDTGFKASLYGNGSEKILAICGTEPEQIYNSEDLLEADFADIGGYGFALNQAVSLVNYILRLTADKKRTDVLQLSWEKHYALPGESLPTDQMYLVDKYDEVGGTHYYVLEARHNGAGEGTLLTEGDTITLTGHSLGGHLAALAQRLFPQLFDQTVTFNAPGFDPISSRRWTDEIVAMFGQYLSVSPATTFASLNNRLVTIESEDSVPGDDADVVSGIITGGEATPEQYLITEKNSHSMSQMVDALGVQALMEKLNPDLTLPETGILLQAASADPGLSEESLINALSVLLLEKSTAVPIVNGDASSNRFSPPPFDSRTSLHQRLIELETAIDSQNQNLTLVSLASFSRSEIESSARNDIPYRYALVHLTPFAILGAEYSRFNQNGELDLHNPATGEGQLTNLYLSYRSEMLSFLIQKNIHDGYNDSNIHFLDIASGENVVRPGLDFVPEKKVVFGSEQGEVLEGQKASAAHPYIGENFNDALFGGGGSDRLYGYGGSDYLEGGTGQDILAGGVDNDILIGGSGIDTYVINDGDGQDTIIDQGQNTLKINGEIFTGVFIREEGTDSYTFTSDDGTAARTYTLTFHSPGTLTIDESTSLVFANQTSAEDFADGQFGLTLWSNEAPTDFNLDLTGTEATNTSELIYFKGESVAYFYGFFEVSAFNPNGTTTGSWMYSENDLSLETSLLLSGGSGNDRLEGMLGADHLIGGEGNDMLWGVSGVLQELASDRQLGDWLEGDAGIDLLCGGGGEDMLYGGDDMDILAGMSGADLLMGERGNDLVVGCAADDTINGGSGDDLLVGDGGLTIEAIFLNSDPYSITLIYSDGYLTGMSSSEIQLDLAFAADGDDCLYGGSGNDCLIGGLGNDLLSGDDENDILWGDNDATSSNGGDDTLYGGAGHDLLYGAGGIDFLRGGSGIDELYGGENNDLLYGDDGNDWLWGDNPDNSGNGDDQLHGGSGDDQLFGGLGNDILKGESGNDRLSGGAGDDVYVFSSGDGTDYINDQEGLNFIRFAGVTSLEGLTWMRGTATTAGSISHNETGKDVLLCSSTGNRVIIRGGFTSGFSLEMGDGTLYTSTELYNAALKFRLYGDGADSLSCTSETDIILAGGGCDIIHGRSGDDLISGSDGFSAEFINQLRLYYLSRLTTFPFESLLAGLLPAMDHNDQLYGEDGNDILEGGGGRDKLFGGNGDDALWGGTDEDTLHGEMGADLLYGGAESDDLYGDDGNDRLEGGADRDQLFGGNGEDNLWGGEDGDTLHGEMGADLLHGEQGADRLYGGEGNDRLEGGTEDDVLEGGLGADYLDGGEGVDTVHYRKSSEGITIDLKQGSGLDGEAEGDVLVNIESVFGSRFTDSIRGNAQANTLVGDGGQDSLYGEDGNDVLISGSSEDMDIASYLDGGAGDDELFGGEYSDILVGDIGNDYLSGGMGLDIMRGGAGDDVLADGTMYETPDSYSFDIMDGGAGNDTYQIDGHSGGFNIVQDQDGQNTVQFVADWGPSDLACCHIGFVAIDMHQVHSLMGSSYWYDNEQWPWEEEDELGDTIVSMSQQQIWSPQETVQDLYISYNQSDSGPASMVVVILGGRNLDLDFIYDFGDGHVYTHAELLAEVMARYQSPYYGEENDLIEGDPQDNTFWAGGGDDTVSGGRGNDTLYGESGGDSLEGNEGDDLLAGGLGADFLQGGRGNDVYLFNRGDGQEFIDDFDLANSTDTLRLGEDIAETDILAIAIEGDQRDLLLRLNNSTDQIRISQYFSPDYMGEDEEPVNHQVERIEFANGVVWDVATVRSRAVQNQEPTANNPFPGAQARAGEAFSLVLPDGVFTDPDTWDWLTYDLRMAEGYSLPEWLSFDAGNRTLSGTPTIVDIGRLELVVSVQDSCGAYAEQTMTLDVLPANSAPEVAQQLADAQTAWGSLFSSTIDAASFFDPNGDTLRYSATLSDGRALPTWLVFDPATRTFSGTPYSLGTISLLVTVTDSASQVATDTFELTVVEKPTLMGTNGSDLLLGGAGTDIITGLSGNDLLRGGAGADLLDGGEGIDTADYRDSDAGVSVNLATGLASGGMADGDVFVAIERIYGSNHQDSLIGSDENNFLAGYDEDDLLAGGLGNDLLRGGDGADLL